MRARAYTESNQLPLTGNITSTLQSILGIEEDVKGDLGKHLNRAFPGSCRWLFQGESFRRWLDTSSNRYKVLWLTGLPGSGKSTLAAQVVDNIQKAIHCQYYFFVAAQPTKRSASYCLRAIAYQLAITYPTFAERLLELHEQTKFSATFQKFQVIWDTIYEKIVFQMDFGSALHWVFDGIDEADAPKLFLQQLMQMKPRSCIKLLLVSRPKRELTSLAGPHIDSVFIEPISIANTEDDIKNYIHAVVRSGLPQDEALQKLVIQRIAKKAEGSFLWTKLALDSLSENWHTMADIDGALNSVPSDMHTMYARMMHNLQNQSPRFRDIGFRVLTWATCAFRPLTLLELETALKPEFDGFVNLAETVIQLCSQFVRIDQDTVCLIHGTARQFLLDPSLDILVEHDHLAVVCLRYLCQDTWRQALAGVLELQPTTSCNKLEPLYNEFPFLRYAVNFWAFHVGLASARAPDLVSSLLLFCNKHILFWIQAVAMSGCLRIIPRAAEYLKRWLRRRRKLGRHNNPSSPNSSETDFLARWTEDLIRLVTKFGDNLTQSPSSIHRHIPPLCPATSAVATIYCRKDGSHLLTVDGLSRSNWDDNLARLSVDQDEIAASIRCTGFYFLTLISYGGIVIIWSTETCEELHRIRHGEWVTIMETNKTGSQVVTGGRQTIAIWDISTGTKLHSVPKHGLGHLVSLNFAKTGANLAISYDDCSIIKYDLETSQESTLLPPRMLNGLGNCPRFMVLSPDHTKLAIGFRGKPVIVLDVASGHESEPRTVIRLDDRDRVDEGGDVFNSPEIARWHPNGSILFILYQDTTILAWSFVDDTQLEFGDTEAREMILNDDGTYILTSSNNGSVSVWGLPKLNLIYTLQSTEFVRDLAFSPDSQRIYDVRGSRCNVWAPEILVRVEELDEEERTNSLDETATSEVVSDVVFAEDQNKNGHVTALVCDNEDEFFCCGRDDGSVSIHDMSGGLRVRKVSIHSAHVDIVAIDWSSSRRFLASADDSGKVIAKRLKFKDDNKWAVYALFETRVEGAILQLLFSLDERLLFISTDAACYLWNTREKAQLCKRARQSEQRCKWMNNPNDESQLLCLEPNRQSIYAWGTLESIATTDNKPLNPGIDCPVDIPSFVVGGPANAQEKVNTTLITESRRYLVYDTTQEQLSQRRRRLRVNLLETSNLTPHSMSIATRATHLDLGDAVRHLLGTFRDRLVFMDHDNWICTATIGGNMGPPKRLYFLPRDWVNGEALHMILMNKKGTLLCARNGEVAIIRWNGRL